MNYITKTFLNFLIFTFKCFLSMALLMFIFIGVTVYQNTNVKITKREIEGKNIPKEFDGFKIAQLSDLHNDYSGEKLEDLAKKVEKEKPDIIALTGDLVDAHRYDERVTLEFIDRIAKIAPMYFVYGNHDATIEGDSEYTRLVEELQNRGVHFLNTKTEKLYIDDKYINIAGIQEPSSLYNVEEFRDIPTYDKANVAMLDKVSKELENEDGFKLLLAHRPEYFETYSDYDFDLVLTGHAHGGQVRLPFIGGLYAPNQGILPKYTAGVHKKNDTTMMISRGLGNSRFPIRVFNTPEVIMVKLKHR